MAGKQEWRTVYGGNRLSYLIGAQGIRTRQCRTVADLITLAIKVFAPIGPFNDCTAAIDKITALSKSERRRRAKASRGIVLKAHVDSRTVRRGRKHHQMQAATLPADLEKQIADFYTSWEWKRLRYDFIKDRDRRCGCCGTTPTDGVRIVVDHIKPIRKFWHLRLDRANLQILCDDCNMGKGSRDETDWRDNVVPFPNIAGS
jgi:5-methylcytosine-specific restriction endonuclease McrA